MAKRKKTSDIMEELLGGMPTAREPESKETGVVKSTNKSPGEGSASPEPEIPNRLASEPIDMPEALIPAFEGLKGDDLDTPTPFVSFRLGALLYALPLGNVESALRMVALTPLPEAPSWVAGAVNLHGSVAPALDLRQRLGGEIRKPRSEDYLLVIKGFERPIALIVDEVTEVLEIPALQVEPPSGPLAKSRPLAGVIRRDDELILILDPARLVPE